MNSGGAPGSGFIIQGLSSGGGGSGAGCGDSGSNGGNGKVYIVY